MDDDSQREREAAPLHHIKTAILIDGGFYQRRALKLFGEKSPTDRAEELRIYCSRHIRESRSLLYRAFYYDCPPSEKVMFHPLTRRHINLGKSEQFKWSTEFFEEIVRKRKFALRRGEELESSGSYILRPDPLKRLCRGDITVEDLEERDFRLDITQKGVDMRIGIDIASLSQARLVDQIIMITGDSDFVPAAKFARRAGVDFILDPMWSRVAKSLNEHVDGVQQCVRRPPENEKDPLHVNHPNFEPKG